MITDQINTTVRIGSLTLQNPIMPASGAFGEEMTEIIDFDTLGALVPKSITKNPQPGNSTPRVCETTSGMINSIGIQSKGLSYYLEHTIPEFAKYSPPLIASISAESIEEFVEMSEVIGSRREVAAIELNISCPNLKGNGEAFGMNANVTQTLIANVKKVTSVPIIAKLTPNVTSIQEIAIAAEKGGADGLVVANTLLAMAIDIHSGKPKIGNVMGGFSGPAVKPIIVRMIYQTAQVTSLPIIGCGGIMNGDDAIEMLLAGASAVQVGTATFVEPHAMEHIIQDIKNYMKLYDIDNVDSLIGAVNTSN